VLKLQLDQAQEQSKMDIIEISLLKEKCEMTTSEMQTLKEKLQAEELTRRQLHNTIQELRGNIRVFCRVRPLVDGEDEEHDHIQYPQDDVNSIVFSQNSESASGNVSSKDYPFSFDKVFQPASSQKDVFEDISQLVQSALDGYNVFLSFKLLGLHIRLWTNRKWKNFYVSLIRLIERMEGPGPENSSNENMGMIPRAVNQIYTSAEKLKEKGWTFEIEGQYLEIYNETIRDLIGSFDPSKKYEIKHNQGKTIVTDLTKGILNA
jgi:kinesin family protein C1